jgi:hypothetical protein
VIKVCRFLALASSGDFLCFLGQRPGGDGEGWGPGWVIQIHL